MMYSKANYHAIQNLVGRRERARRRVRRDHQKACRQMIRSIEIHGYRTFKNFSVEGLGRVNLFVGKNNTGKSSLLEALALLEAGDNLGQLWATLARRGEMFTPELVPGRPIAQEVDVSHLFTGHQLKLGTEFRIKTTNQKPARELIYTIEDVKFDNNPTLFGQFAALDPTDAAIALRVQENGEEPTNQVLPLTSRGTLRQEIFQLAVNNFRAKSLTKTTKAQFVTTSSLNLQDLIMGWNEIALKPEEDLVLEALRFIDHRIERIAPNSSPIYIGNRGGFWIKRQDEERLPIGSFGDGIWRLLALSVVLARAKSSILLVDEIDTGLHYSVMESVWQFILKTAEKFDVQVFATSHSYDCMIALSKVCRNIKAPPDLVSVQRIESDKNHSIPFTASELLIAAENAIEIR